MAAKKAKQSLEEGLSASANKRGFKGKKRKQYIGGAIRNMQKRGAITIHRKPAQPKQRGMFGIKAAAPPKKKEVKKRNVKIKPEPVRRETSVRVPKGQQIKLVHKKNEAATRRLGYNVYSVYYAGRDGKQFSDAVHRSPEAARKEASLAMTAHNHKKGVHTQASFGPRQRQYLT